MDKSAGAVVLWLSSYLSVSGATSLRVSSPSFMPDVLFTADCKWGDKDIKDDTDGLHGLLTGWSPPSPPCSPPSPAPHSLVDPYLSQNLSRLSEVSEWFILSTYVGEGVPGDDGGCSIKERVALAAKAGYSAVIIQLAQSKSKDRGVVVNGEYGPIFPCLVSYEDGQVLQQFYYNNVSLEQYTLTFFEDDSIDGWTRYIVTTFLCIIAILLAIAMSYCVVQMFILIVIWIRDTIVHAVEQRRINRRRRLPYRQLRKLPVQTWGSDIPGEMCTICLENYGEGVDRVRILPCSHVFHMECIDPWLLNQRRKCPNCKRKIVFPDEPYDSDSSTDDERTPLIRGQGTGTIDHSIGGGLTFTFNESDFANHNEPIYRQIHRMILDRQARQREREASGGGSSSGGSGNESQAGIHHQDAAHEHALRHERLSKCYSKKWGSNSMGDGGGGGIGDHYIVDDTVSVGEGPSTSASARSLPATTITPNPFLEDATKAYEEAMEGSSIGGEEEGRIMGDCVDVQVAGGRRV